MRTNLITHFFCLECGRQLMVDYDRDDSPRKIEAEVQTTREPTGADCRYNQILVQPCQHCIEVKTKSASKIVDGVREILSGSQNE